MTKSYEYKDILNRLSDMQRVPYYAVACHDLVKAEMAIVALENERDALRTLITRLHAAKGRYHTQLAACDLFDAVGLKNERPVK